MGLMGREILPPGGMGGKEITENNVLWGVKIFYFSLFLDNSKLYFCGYKSLFAHIVGYRFDIINSITLYRFDIIISILLAMTIEHPKMNF